ncbi:MAG: ribonuclease Z [Bacteroidales bacterium]|jgi:ribonuclease Z|nr:ribonuclease Z [Bacteroidales bacterium]
MLNHELSILGSSSALPTSQRFSSAQILRIFERFFLIDCGEGTQIQLRRLKIPFNKIRAIFISHLHGDHYLGIFGVLSSFNMLGRTAPLNIYSPKGLEQLVRMQLRFVEKNLSFDLRFIEIPHEERSELYVDKKVVVRAFKLNHRIPCFAFEFSHNTIERNIIKECISLYNLSLSEIALIKSGGDLTLENGHRIANHELTYTKHPVSFLYVTDTRFKPSLAELISMPPTLLYHEATFDVDLAQRARETYHSTSEEAAQFASLVQAQHLIIGHFSARYHSVEKLILQARALFPNTDAAEDLQRFTF